MDVAKNGRPRDGVPVMDYALLDDLTHKVRLRDHMLAFRHPAKLDMTGLIWGATGTVTQNMAMLAAHNEALNQRKLMVPIQFWYRFDDLSESIRGGMICRNPPAGKGLYKHAEYIHTDRLAMAERTMLCQELIDVIGEERGTRERNKAAALEWPHLMATYPEHVISLFERYSKLKMIIHPVYPVGGDADSNAKPWFIATMRAEAKRILAIRAPYHQELDVVF